MKSFVALYRDWIYLSQLRFVWIIIGVQALTEISYDGTDLVLTIINMGWFNLENCPYLMIFIALQHFFCCLLSAEGWLSPPHSPSLRHCRSQPIQTLRKTEVGGYGSKRKRTISCQCVKYDLFNSSVVTKKIESNA